MEKKATILAVDDAEINLDVLGGILKKYDLIPAISGRDALDILKDESVDLILLDIMMPEMDGYEVCRALKSDERTKNIPIIFLTAKTTESDIKEGFERGAVDYVTKPFNPIELISRVETHLELRDHQINLEKLVKKEIEKNRAQEQILNQQSKQAAIGELLMYIAHQWKEPLSELGSLNLYTLAKLEKNEDITRDELKDGCQKSDQIIRFMSKTVETFQDFYKPSSQKSFFGIYDAFTQASNIIAATLHYHNINLQIHKNGNPKAFGNENEYAQVILNILSNAKDALVQNRVKEPRITVDITTEGEKSKVTISDNAGGISAGMVDGIFDPFSSGKESVGFGLYISKTILEKNGGTIKAQNCDDGAQFVIEL